MPELTPEEWRALLERLAEPFDPAEIHWRAGATARDKKKAQALPYAEPRTYEDRLNTVCPGDWSVSFKPWGESRIICELTIGELTRASTGEESKGVSPGTAAEAQAFKRACSKFGLGRYLYDVPIAWVGYDNGRSRLTEAPKLPAKFLPRPHLPAERVRAMAEELGKLGLTPEAQLELAREVTGNPAANLGHLTEAEAAELWRRAKRVKK